MFYILLFHLPVIYLEQRLRCLTLIHNKQYLIHSLIIISTFSTGNVTTIFPCIRVIAALKKERV